MSANDEYTTAYTPQVRAEQYITERELAAHLTPIKESLWETRSDVKILLLRSAGNKAVSVTFWRAVTVLSTLLCGVLAGFIVH